MDYLSSIVEDNDNSDQIAEKLTNIRAKIENIIGEAPLVRPVPEAEIISETDCGKYIRRKITFAVEAKERISAYILIPKNIKESVPAVLCLHGTSYNGKENVVARAPELPGRNYGHELAELGYVTFAIDDPAMGERNPLEKSYDTSHFYKRYPDWSIIGKMIWDYGCAIDYLSTLDFVDSSRLGGTGHSLGATTLLFLAALEPRLKVSAASCGWSSLHWRQPRLDTFINPDHGYIRLMK
ncbi:MAG: alpha/beta hydrolase family protein, partial [Victivallaceae bacterium]|nr:alpha/beta hydrolase family protein [Victivallaceae bacterium]